MILIQFPLILIDDFFRQNGFIYMYSHFSKLWQLEVGGWILSDVTINEAKQNRTDCFNVMKMNLLHAVEVRQI